MVTLPTFSTSVLILGIDCMAYWFSCKLWVFIEDILVVCNSYILIILLYGFPFVVIQKKGYHLWNLVSIDTSYHLLCSILQTRFLIDISYSFMFLTRNASDVGAISIIYPNSFIVLLSSDGRKSDPLLYLDGNNLKLCFSLLVVFFLVPYLLTLLANPSCCFVLMKSDT